MLSTAFMFMISCFLCVGYLILKKSINTHLLNEYCKQEIDFNVSQEMKDQVDQVARRLWVDYIFAEPYYINDLKYFVDEGISLGTLETQLEHIGSCARLYSYVCEDLLPIIHFLRNKLQEVNIKRDQLGLQLFQDLSPQTLSYNDGPIILFES